MSLSLKEKETFKKLFKKQRSKYMDGKIGHCDYYLWLAGFLNVPQSLIPFTVVEIKKSSDPHLNDLPLKIWDKQHFYLTRLAYDKGLNWALSDTVCVLKAMARMVANKPKIYGSLYENRYGSKPNNDRALNV